jgi:hypothetical protein
MSPFLIILVILLVIALVPGYYGSRSWGWGPYYGWSPLLIIVLIIVLAYALGWLAL